MLRLSREARMPRRLAFLRALQTQGSLRILHNPFTESSDPLQKTDTFPWYTQIIPNGTTAGRQTSNNLFHRGLCIDRRLFFHFSPLIFLKWRGRKDRAVLAFDELLRGIPLLRFPFHPVSQVCSSSEPFPLYPFLPF